MKGSRLLTLCLASSVLSAAPSQAALIGYWPFDEGAGTSGANAQGNAALNAALQANSVWGGDHTGGAGSSLEMDGTYDSRATVAPIGGFFSNMTITAWLNPDVTAQAWTGIFGSRVGGPNQIGFGFSGSTGNLVYTWNGNSNTTWGWGTGLNVPLNEWSFVALALSPTGASIFLGTAGGGLVSATNAIPHTTEAGLNWAVGVDDCCGFTRNFDGEIDDLAIWDQTLDAGALTALFNGSATPLTVPEPSAFGLLGLAAALLVTRRRRRA